MDRHVIRPSDLKRSTRCSIIDSTLQFITPTIALGYRERLDGQRLQTTLTEVLDDFGTFAGRFVRRDGALWIEPREGGALFEVAHSSDSMAALGVRARVEHSDAVCPSLSILGIARGTAPLFAARITYTRDGSVLGVSWNHAVGDAHSAALLLRAWSLAYHGQPHERPQEAGDRAAYLASQLPAPENDALGHRVLPWPEFLRCCYHHYWQTGPARRVKLDYSWPAVAELHSAVSPDTSVTPQQTLYAHLFLSVRRFLGLTSSSQVTNAINYRKRLGLPENLIGNLSDMVTATGNHWDDTATVAKAIRKSADAIGTGPMAHRDLARLQITHPRTVDRARYWNSSCHPCRTNLHINNIAGLKLDELRFGGEQPRFVHMRSSNLAKGPAIGQCNVYRQPDDAGLSFDLLLPIQVARRLEVEQSRSVLDVLRDNERRVARRPGPSHNQSVATL